MQLLILLIFGSIVFFVKAKPDIENLIAYFSAALNKSQMNFVHLYPALTLGYLKN